MAVPKHARVRAAREVGPCTRLLDLELEDGSPFGFRGGQYGIVNTGAVLEGGKPAKRAYSFLSNDREQATVQIAVKRLDGGPGSGALHDVAIGGTLAFSGPWGKMVPEDGERGRSLLFATDTGITAALGLAQSAAFTTHAKEADLLWYIESDSYFLPESFVRDRLEPHGVKLTIAEALPAKHPERVAHARALVAQYIDTQGLPSDAFLSGDGLLVYDARDALVTRGCSEARVKLEAFFHNPARKAP